MREDALAQIQPDAVDQVQFGCVERQRHQRYVAGDMRRMGTVPTGLLQQYHGTLVGSMLSGDAKEKAARQG